MARTDRNVDRELPDAKWRQSLRHRLLAWYDRGIRDLPWRANRHPYRIWISEIMLQQTQVATVIPYFQRFIKRFPDVQVLAKAKEESVLRMWEGLGYYRRARQLHRAAKQIANDFAGEFPTDFDDVMSLPGIGRYTAGAITSIAYDQRRPILEANSIRVYCRLWGLEMTPQSTAGQKQLWAFAESILPTKRSGNFNEAVMELGSEVCTVQNPHCESCRVKTLCSAFLQGKQHLIPPPKKKMNYEDVHEVAIIVWRENRVLLRECQEGERWAGLWDFPRFVSDEAGKAGFARQVKKLTGINIRTGRQRMTIKHGVTRFRITLDCYDAKYAKGTIADRTRMRWIDPTQLSNVPLSVTGRKIAKKLI